MARNEQFEILLHVLRRFQEAGILQDLMLIGSWCVEFYRYHFEHPEKLPAFRTLDVDFLIPHISKIRTEVNVPEILKKEGFVPSYNRANGIVKYNHKELQVEFLLPELGRGGRVREIKNLHVKAVALRYLNFLLDHPLFINYEGLRVRVPDPSVFALHKLIVSTRRVNKEKQKSDRETGIAVLEFLQSQPGGKERIDSIFKKLPRNWKAVIHGVKPVIDFAPSRNK